MIRVVVCRVGQPAAIMEVEDFDAILKIIGGYGEQFRMGKYDILCDEEGQLKNLPINRTIRGQALRGTLVITKLLKDGLAPLTPSEAEWLVRDLAPGGALGDGPQRGYVRTTNGTWAVQLPEESNPWRFVIVTEEQRWSGGYGWATGESWEVVEDAKVPTDVKMRLAHLLLP